MSFRIFCFQKDGLRYGPDKDLLLFPREQLQVRLSMVRLQLREWSSVFFFSLLFSEKMAFSMTEEGVRAFFSHGSLQQVHFAMVLRRPSRFFMSLDGSYIP